MPTEAQRYCFRQQGYIILENILSESVLGWLQSCCDEAVDWKASEMRSLGIEEDGINLLGKRYFISGYRKQNTELDRFLFGDAMAKISSGLLGNTVYLHNDQFVVKGQDQRSRFAWHQDSGYSVYRGGAELHQPYLTCWIALDDMSAQNGTISVLSFNELGEGKLVEHWWDEDEAAMIGYTGGKSGSLMEVSAGSIVCFSSFTMHRSGMNRTEHLRRSYIVQYASTAFGFQNDPQRRYAPSGGIDFIKESQQMIQQASSSD
jgi:ectoine hydroxylase-related dioxygenase (phytanoyl-CoA dioxygenase family)